MTDELREQITRDLGWTLEIGNDRYEWVAHLPLTSVRPRIGWTGLLTIDSDVVFALEKIPLEEIPPLLYGDTLTGRIMTKHLSGFFFPEPMRESWQKAVVVPYLTERLRHEA
jgi:hypothetical protein